MRRIQADHLRSTVQAVLRSKPKTCSPNCTPYQGPCNPPDIEDLGEFVLSRNLRDCATRSAARHLTSEARQLAAVSLSPTLSLES